ncbi:AfsR/SARP family transcriptional regulator [Kitasatospora cineracea]|uniref:AfsR/SARP family transcriptional regulator n=1 Tax=Kitasatospora cineracea TaxID=88074 RepID=UPI003680A368
MTVKRIVCHHQSVMFYVLGPLRISSGGPLIGPRGARDRTFLAELLAHSGSVVSAQHIVETVWPDRLPANRANALHVRISRLRSLFRDITGSDDAPQVISTHPEGYRIEPSWTDAARFEALVAEAERDRRTGAPAAAADKLAEALGLWQGDPYLDVTTGDCVTAEARRLTDLRLNALELQAEVLLSLGAHSEVVNRLSAVAGQYPLRERLHGHLITALHRAGRSAEALVAYAGLRTVLNEELGTEPNRHLRQLHQVVLTQQDAHQSTEPPAPPRPPAPVVEAPFQLPPDIGDFVGRQDTVADLVAALTGSHDQALPIATVTGRGGSGKTALAVRAAHRLRGTFPDGQLYLDLHADREHPADPAEVLARVLVDLGMSRTAVPDGVERRSAAYRSVLANRRVLVLLDNARDEAQVQPLLPGTAGCAVLVTSRARLTGLAATCRTELRPLDPVGSRELLARIAGPERIATSPWSADEIASRCDHLPLALRIAGARLSARPYWSVSDLAARLADERCCLDELRHGTSTVRASLDADYRALAPHDRHLLHRLGTLGPARFTADATAGLLEVRPGELLPALERLADVSLLDVESRHGADGVSFGFTNLTRVYARERARAEHPGPEGTGCP